LDKTEKKIEKARKKNYQHNDEEGGGEFHYSAWERRKAKSSFSYFSAKNFIDFNRPGLIVWESVDKNQKLFEKYLVTCSM
jgi:hypothetical protein